jgi:hypothetical protein
MIKLLVLDWSLWMWIIWGFLGLMARDMRRRGYRGLFMRRSLRLLFDFYIFIASIYSLHILYISLEYAQI